MSETCPHCGADLTGAEIPEESRHYYGGMTHGSRKIGHQVDAVYDGVLFWSCPDCGQAWPKDFGPAFRNRSDISADYVEVYNEASGD